MALRLDVVEAAACEVFRAPPSLGRQLEARQRAERRAASESTVVAVWPEEPGLTPAPTLLRRRHLLLHGHRAASPGATSLARRRHARRRPARRRLLLACSAACAALPLPRRLRRDACAATPHAAPPRAAPPRPAPPRTAPPPSPAQRPRREAVSPPRAARRLV